MRKPINSATVFTHGDSSVGIPSVTFDVELYIDEMASDEYVKEIRDRLKEFYEDMTGDDCSVMFDIEIQRQQELEAEMERQQMEHDKETDEMYREQDEHFAKARLGFD
jgi:hypothetical protein